MIILEAGASELVSLFVIVLVAAVAPLLAALTRGRVPDVVWLLVLGLLIGPSVLGWAHGGDSISFVREIGMGLLFLLAGYEMPPRPLRSRLGRSATLTWVICLGIAFGIATVVVPGHSWQVAAALGICLCSTALGTLLPILKSSGEAGTPLGKAVMLHGAAGELCPVIAMSLLLSSRGALTSTLLLLAFAVATLLAAAVPARILNRVPWIGRTIEAGSNTTAQTTLRFVFVLLMFLMAVSAVFDLDVVLGAFAAGAIVRAFVPEDHSLDEKLEVVAFSFLVPVFFVTSGMSISVAAVAANPGLLVVFVALMLVARGLPVYLLDRFTNTGSGIESDKNRMRLGLYAATGLPIIVAVTEVAVSEGLMPADIGSILVASGGFTVLLFPLLASLLLPAAERASAGAIDAP